MFDAPPSDKTTRTWSGDVPIDERPWQVGLIVGPSGCGKSTIARQMFGEESRPHWPERTSIVDSFPREMPLEAITEALGAVGFNTIPSWIRPHATLSNGERFRCDLARILTEPGELAWCDEFTSVVDRQVAQIGSHAVQKFVRRQPARRFVAVSCHYDIVDWLQPDWTLEPATMTFTWRSLRRRPSVELDIRRVPHATWSLFAPYHYMTGDLHRAATCFAAHVGGRPVAFVGIIPLPHAKVRDIRRVSRLVTLPDWQGLGLAFVLVDSLGAAYKAIGFRLRTYPAHPALVRAFSRSDLWSECKEAGTFSVRNSNIGGGGRPCGTYEWRGAASDERASRMLIGRG